MEHTLWVKEVCERTWQAANRLPVWCTESPINKPIESKLLNIVERRRATRSKKIGSCNVVGHFETSHSSHKTNQSVLKVCSMRVLPAVIPTVAGGAIRRAYRRYVGSTGVTGATIRLSVDV
jgi:hypothetical protein